MCPLKCGGKISAHTYQTPQLVSTIRPRSHTLGYYCNLQVDKLMTHDVCGPGTFGIFQQEFGMDAQVWDNEKVILIPDHYIFTNDERANRNVDMLR